MGQRIPQEKTPMKCPICKHGQTQPGHVTAAFDRPDGGAIIFRSVPAQVCDNCGERYFDDQTTARLLRLARQGEKSGTEVEVRNYAAA